MAPLSNEIRPISSCTPPHIGPAIPEVGCFTVQFRGKKTRCPGESRFGRTSDISDFCYRIVWNSFLDLRLQKTGYLFFSVLCEGSS